MAELKKNMSQLRSIHQAKLEIKDALCEAEKGSVAMELQTTYNVMLPKIHAQQFEAGY